MKKIDTVWLTNPTEAYADWQAREAAGADRRHFSEQSIRQHRAMFEHFMRHLSEINLSLASFGPDHIDSFLARKEAKSYAIATRKRYLKLIERLCRQLVCVGVRMDNPAAQAAANAPWPDDEPLPLYLEPADDTTLQGYVQPDAIDEVASVRAKALVALFVGAGVTVAECRTITVDDVWPEVDPPYLVVRAHGARDARTVHLEPFAIAPLARWKSRRRQLPIAGELLFPFVKSGTPPTAMGLGNAIAGMLAAAAIEADEPSPRTLRNTFARRRLLDGDDPDTVSTKLGLTSRRTCDRLLATIGRDEQ